MSQGLDLAGVPAILRVLLVTDGTVTRILEAHLQEKIAIEVLKHEELRARSPIPELGVKAGEPLLEREVLLKGSRTGVVYAYAETLAPLAALAPELRKSLLEGKQGVGELLLAHRLETFREVIRSGRAKVGKRSASLKFAASDSVLERSYLIHLGKRPAFLITEVFPEGAFG